MSERPFLDFLRDRLDKRIELAGERKWAFISVALIVLAVMCGSALSLILSGIGLILKAIGTVAMAVASVISVVAGLISGSIAKILGGLFLILKSILRWTYETLGTFCRWVWSKIWPIK